MAGLLKQLQKPKADKGSASGDLLMGSSFIKRPKSKVAPQPLPPVEQVSDEELAAGKLLEGLLQESNRPIAMPGAKEPEAAGGMRKVNHTKQIRAQTQANLIRKKGMARPAPAIIGKREEKLPWWLTEEKSTSPQVEMLVPQARSMLNEILPADGDIDIDITEAVKKAVSLASDTLRAEIRISEKDQKQSEEELLSLLTGKGPLQPLYDDSSVTDIFVDGYKSIRVIRRGQAMETPFYFRSREEYRAYLSSMLASVDRVLNLSSPIVDCVLDDEWRSRINAVDASVIEGVDPRICIRVPRLQQVSFYDILQTKTLPATLAAWLAELVVCGKANILVMGPTGSGKTVMTTALLSAVNSDERIITIEDVPEIFIPTCHLEKLVSRPANAQGQGEVKMPALLKAALRRAPHRIVVGEIRDEEGRLFLRALETGHEGSIATIHADDPVDGMWRLLDVVAAYERAPQESIMRRIGRSVHIILNMRKEEGKPTLVEVSEVRKPLNGEFITKSLVRFEGMVDGKKTWRLKSTHSEWIDFIRERGLELRPGPGLLPPEAPEALQ